MSMGFFAAGAMGQGGGPSMYTTLNPLDKSGQVSLSGGNLVATGGSSSSGIVRSIHPIVGKRYFEAVFTNQPGTGAVIGAGVANGSHVLTASLGFASGNANGWGFWGRSGYGARHNGVTAVAGNSDTNDVFGFAVDEPGHKLWISKNGAWIQGDPETDSSPIWTNLSGTLYAAACPWATTVAVTMRFDPATFRDAAPAGFSPITG